MTTQQFPDLLDPDSYVDGSCHDAFRFMREHAPVHQHPDPSPDGGSFWAVTSYAGCATVFRNHKIFSSSIYESEGRLTGGSMFETYPPTDIRGSQTIPQHLDLPKHNEYKRMVAREFTEKQIVPLKARIHEVTRAALDAVSDRDECDFVTEIAAEIPLIVLMEMLGIPSHDRDLPKRMMGPVFGFQDAEKVSGAGASAEELYAQFKEYLRVITAFKRDHPSDDLLSAIALAEIDGRHMTAEEITDFVTGGVVGAGFDTTLGAVSMGLSRLLEFPDQLQRLRDNPMLLKSAVDEMLRYDPAVIMLRRNCRQTFELQGQTIEPGQKVMAIVASANRDEREFAEPEAFDIARTPNRHLSFGHGLHRCLGTWLARAEFEIIIEETLARFEHLELTGPPVRVRGTWVGGLKRLPIRYVSRAA